VEQRRKTAQHREALIARRKAIEAEALVLAEEARQRALHAEVSEEQMRTLWARAHHRQVRREVREAKLAFRIAQREARYEAAPTLRRGLLLAYTVSKR
jgi:hypothetical protein